MDSKNCNCCASASAPGQGKGAGQAGQKGQDERKVLYLIPKNYNVVGSPGASSTSGEDPAASRIIDDETLKKHFDMPPRALYLNSFRRPLITFPMNQEGSSNFNAFRKQKTNQQILDGILHPSEAVHEPSTFPYPRAGEEDKTKPYEEEEVVYLIELPDCCDCECSDGASKAPRYIWHSVKKDKKGDEKDDGLRPRLGGGPLNRPKPWVMSRLTDFDAQSQW